MKGVIGNRHKEASDESMNMEQVNGVQERGERRKSYTCEKI